MSIDLGNSNVQRKIEINTGPGLELPAAAGSELRAGTRSSLQNLLSERTLFQEGPSGLYKGLHKHQRRYFNYLSEFKPPHVPSVRRNTFVLPNSAACRRSAGRVTEFQKAARIRETNLSLNSTEPRLLRGRSSRVFFAKRSERGPPRAHLFMPI
ncbi:hypothetical protein EVAR_99677_1 [Eumeta japonica]|uniref:Uncharacterized protein n=1 Tax=Eumeta variegata TaxID=151549 RepID=A0A4C1YIM6_EUMVA|nr:hypothetical protein EVAR_99677_1 [Eumeta japonica]